MNRFWQHTQQQGECIVWVGCRDRQGYGKLGRNGRTWRAHRYVYEQTVGPIPAGMVIDHLCRNPSCVNVDHLEVVTQRVNVLRGETIPAAQAARTHCPHGHEYTAENIYWAGNHRRCATCVRERMRLRREAA